MDILAILGCLLGGGGIMGFIQFMISRHDKKDEKLDSIISSISGIKAEMSHARAESERENAETWRMQILRFDDELYNGVHHSKVMFEQMLKVVRKYDRYVENNDDFENGVTEPAARHIQEEYDRLYKEHKL